jgi:hypothetical protein
MDIQGFDDLVKGRDFRCQAVVLHLGDLGLIDARDRRELLL